MKNIGYLKTSQSETAENMTGEINTLAARVSLKLFKQKHKTSEKAPDYTIYGTGYQGNSVHIGVAWIRKGKERQFLSLEIDDPSFETKLSLLGFKKQDGGYDLMWQRQS